MVIKLSQSARGEGELVLFVQAEKQNEKNGLDRILN